MITGCMAFAKAFHSGTRAALILWDMRYSILQGAGLRAG
ncbi:hypothetical protein NSU_2400 [Novosphingobium pentaromativorans US6-1]|uniref:Uncharacterized protein n=1 Tax=Novosphingobium pentaromativorans US6-1 TaxID=1088721 RepID=G6EDH9_9SPHN|nr:hypothetical protein NSU_2400 [Novosphingobium pentaromativorans US6-1]